MTESAALTGVIGAATSAVATLANTVYDLTGNLSDTQLRRYGQYTLAAAAMYYVGTSFKASVPADAQYAIDAHLPQGYDRSVIASRLEQRHAKAVLLQCLEIQQLRDSLRAETSREAKLRHWQQVFERTLVGLLSGAYVHSLNLSLFTVKNTVRVLVFVLRRREDTEKESKDPDKRAAKGPLGKVKAWWSGGTQSLIMESLMQRVSDQMEKQASPFANAGLDEESVPAVPGGGAGMGGRDAFVYSQMVSRELSAAAAAEEDDDTSNPSDNEEDEGRPRNSSSVSNSSAAWTAAATADAERLFSVKDTLSVAIPRVVATAATVVRRVLKRHEQADAQRFSIAGGVTPQEMRSLLVDLCAEMERSACVAEWLYEGPGASGPSCSPLPREASVLSATFPGGPSTPRARRRSAGENAEKDEEDDDVVRFPAGSTTLLGPDGRPIPKTYRGLSESSPGNGTLAGSEAEDEAFMNSVFGLRRPSLPSAEVRRAKREAMRQELIVKQQTTAFFQELIHSASFGELCLQYAESTLVKAMHAAMDITGVKSYEPATNSARMLMVIPFLEGLRQRVTDSTEFEVQPSMRLFCEETVRSTCANAGK